MLKQQSWNTMEQKLHIQKSLFCTLKHFEFKLFMESLFVGADIWMKNAESLWDGQQSNHVYYRALNSFREDDNDQR